MKLVNIVVEHLLSQHSLSEGMEPDTLDISNTTIPSDDFVVCRDHSGEVTARYGEDNWNMSPWSFIEDKTSVNFDFNTLRTVDRGLSTYEDEVVSQTKLLSFVLMYMLNRGIVGTLSLGTMSHKVYALKRVAKFCIENSNHDESIHIYPNDIFSSVHTMAYYLRDGDTTNSHREHLSRLLDNFQSVDPELLGFTVINYDIDHQKDTDQTPLIPSRIYFSFYQDLTNEIDHLHRHKDKLESFLAEFEDHLYGVSITKQRKDGGGNRYGARPTMKEAIKEHGLEDFFTGHYACNGRHVLSGVIGKIQHILLISTLFFTGMRNQEGRGIKYDCITKKHVPIKKKGRKIEAKQTLSIISRTTKYDGYKRKASWIAPEQVTKTIKVAQSICRSLVRINKLNIDECHLFIDPAGINGKRLDKSVAFMSNQQRRRGFWGDKYVISKDDYAELLISDSDRDWANQDRFQLGRSWKFSHHQFRRSLAFYAANSGLVSLNSIRRQFKQVSLLMARYYAKNYHNMISILGVQKKRNGIFEMPSTHIAHEFQTGISLNVANKIVMTMLGSDQKLFGNMGTYIERNRVDLLGAKLPPIAIAEKVYDTQKRVRAGELNYTKTLLGGCTINGKCDQYALGDFTSCIGCDGGIIEEQKVFQETNRIKEELTLYDTSSIEYDITFQEYVKLDNYSRKNFENAEVKNG
jgi:hypothetical protein